MNNKIAIIGGGFSGIYALKYCIQENLNCKLFESSDSIGGVWKYDKNPGGVLNNTYASSSVTYLQPTDFPFPDDTAEFPHHSKVYKHLLDYVEHFNLNQYIQLNTYINKITKKYNKWYVNYNKNNTEINEVFDKVIICTGINQNVNIPKDKVFNNFDKNKIIHSHYYEQNKDKFKDKNILVVGGGETAHDIACDLSRISNKVYVSIRNGQWFQGKIFSAYEPADLYFNRYMHFLSTIILQSFIGFVNELLWGTGGSGIKQWKPPSYSGLSFTTYSESTFTKGREILLWIAKGKVFPRKNILNIKNNTIYFENDKVKVDYIVLCTGYNISHLQKLLPNINYDKYKYKLIFDPDDTSLSYCGYIRPIITSLTLVAELQARLISKVYSNKIQLPNEKKMKQIITKDNKKNKRKFKKNYNRLNYIINPYSYCDDIASLIGCKPNMFKLFFTNNKLWKNIFFYPWSQFHYTINSDNEKTRNISITQLNKNKNSICGKRLFFWSILVSVVVVITVLLIFIPILKYSIK